LDSPKKSAKAHRPRRSALTWVDLLVIAATSLTFGAIVLANKPPAKAQSHAGTTTTLALPQQPQHIPADLALIKARIRLING
jgi:hypothetical protein